MYMPLAYYDGYCARCQDDSPLVVAEEGPRGLRAWLSGVGPEDRALSYTCRTCGLREHVPFSESEDDEYAATLPTWPDWNPPAIAPEPVDLAPTVPVLDGDVFASAATRLSALEPLQPTVAPEPPGAPSPTVAPEASGAPSPTIRVVTLPVQRVSATDDHLLGQSTG